jgi:hypothetical protein
MKLYSTVQGTHGFRLGSCQYNVSESCLGYGSEIPIFFESVFLTTDIHSYCRMGG